MAEQGWETVSELVLGRHLLLWDEIMEQAFVQVSLTCSSHRALIMPSSSMEASGWWHHLALFPEHEESWSRGTVTAPE